MEKTTLALIRTALVLTALLLFASMPFIEAFSETPQLQWSKTYGGYWASKIIETSDGGYAIVAKNNTLDSKGDNCSVALLVKTDSSGELQWAKTYGPEFGVNGGVLSVVQTSDTGFALCSYSGKGWLIKTNSDGIVEWNKTLNVEAGYAYFTSLTQTDDQGFILTSDGWFWNMSGFGGLHKTDEYGNIVWSKIYATQSAGDATSVTVNFAVPTTDGGYTLAGSRGSIAWFAKTDSKGELELSKTYEYGVFKSVYKASDGNYVLPGLSGYGVGWLIKVNSEGVLLWNQSFSQSGRICLLDSAREISNEYVAAGYSSKSIHNYAFFAVTDFSGRIAWNATYEERQPSAVTITEDGGFAIAGSNDDAIWLDKLAPVQHGPPDDDLPDSSTHSFSSELIIAVAVIVVSVLGLSLIIYLRKRE